MRLKHVCIMLTICIFASGCSTDSKESLENRSINIMKKMVKTLNSISDNNSAKDAIIELERLQKELNDVKIKLAEYGEQDIASEYGIRVFNYSMKELFPAMGRAGQNISPELNDKIADIITSGGHSKAREASWRQVYEKAVKYNPELQAELKEAFEKAIKGDKDAQTKLQKAYEQAMEQELKDFSTN